MYAIYFLKIHLWSLQSMLDETCWTVPINRTSLVATCHSKWSIGHKGGTTTFCAHVATEVTYDSVWGAFLLSFMWWSHTHMDWPCANLCMWRWPDETPQPSPQCWCLFGDISRLATRAQEARTVTALTSSGKSVRGWQWGRGRQSWAWGPSSGRHLCSMLGPWRLCRPRLCSP